MKRWWLILFLFISFGVVNIYFSWTIPNKSDFSFGPDKSIGYGVVNTNIPSGRLEVVRCVFILNNKIWCYRGENFLGIIKKIDGIMLNDRVMMVERNQKKVESLGKNVSEVLVEKDMLEKNILLGRDLLLGVNDDGIITMVVYAS